MNAPPLRLDELGSVQFERFCAQLLDLAGEPVDARPWGTLLLLPDGTDVPDGDPLPGPALVVVAWLRDGSQEGSSAVTRLQTLLAEALRERAVEPRSLLLLTNVAAAEAAIPPGLEAAVLGPAELWERVRARTELRFRVPALLGVCDLEALLPGATAKASTADLDAAVELARVFVPTRAYLRALDVLRRHGFVVLTGPPEMGKTAIARKSSGPGSFATGPRSSSLTTPSARRSTAPTPPSAGRSSSTAFSIRSMSGTG